MTTTPDRGEQAEGVVQVAIMLIIGTTAGAASFTHVHDVAYAHGQPDWIGWADACVVELMSLALGLELRRRARTGRPTTFVLTALVFFIAVSLAAQVVEAEPSMIGWLAAALPALGFLVLAKVVLSRTVAAQITTASIAEPTHTPEPVQTPEALVTGARIVADSYHRAVGAPITRDALAERMRISTDAADRLLAALGHASVSAPATPSTHVNGRVVLQEATS
jgi:Protein of unknown function (DUF2637)